MNSSEFKMKSRYYLVIHEFLFKNHQSQMNNIHLLELNSSKEYVHIFIVNDLIQ